MREPRYLAILPARAGPIMRRKIVLYELNEVPWRVFDQFAEWRPKSHLARLLPVMRRLSTFAEDRSDLSPWITWPTAAQ